MDDATVDGQEDKRNREQLREKTLRDAESRMLTKGPGDARRAAGCGGEPASDERINLSCGGDSGLLCVRLLKRPTALNHASSSSSYGTCGRRQHQHDELY